MFGNEIPDQVGHDDYLFSAVATSTAQATVQPTIGLLPIPGAIPANCASECIRPIVSVIYPMATVRTRYVRVYAIGHQYRMRQYFAKIRVAIYLRDVTQQLVTMLFILQQFLFSLEIFDKMQFHW